MMKNVMGIYYFREKWKLNDLLHWGYNKEIGFCGSTRLVNGIVRMELLWLGLDWGRVGGRYGRVVSFDVCWSFRLLGAFIRPLILSLSGFICVSLFLLSCSSFVIRSVDLKNLIKSSDYVLLFFFISPT